jgi:hypothetical protein
MKESEAISNVAQRLSSALNESDLAAFGDLLDPNARWGPLDSTSPPCTNKKQVLSWYRRGAAAGASAQVTEVVVEGDHLMVGLSIEGLGDADERTDHSSRWQVFTVRDGLIVDIVGFDSRSAAAQRAGVN